MRKLTKTAAIVASMAVMAMGTTIMTHAATEGWVQSGADWYYYVKGDKVSNQWVKAGEKWYFIDEEGRMVKNTFVRTDKYDGSSEVLDDEDIHSTLGQDDIDDDSEFYYLNADGTMVTGWKEFKASSIYASPNSSRASTVWYYFGATGRMYVNEWLESSGKWYALSSNGQMYAEAVINNDLIDWDADTNYYMNKDGAMVTGWYKTTENIAGSAPEEAIRDGGESDTTHSVFFEKKDKWVYGDPNTGVLAEMEWKEINGKYYFFGIEAAYNDRKDVDIKLETIKYEDNKKAGEKNITSGNIEIDEGFIASGSAVNVVAVPLVIDSDNLKDDALNTFGMYSDVFVRWTNHGGDGNNKKEYFYLQKDGDALTAWKELDDDYWICGNSKGELYYDEIAKINGKYYYFDEFGICDEKYLNNTVDYIAVIDPKKTSKTDNDGDYHIKATNRNMYMYETTSSRNVYDKGDNAPEGYISIADMKKELLEIRKAKDNKDYYYIDGRKVSIKSMTDNEVILAYTAVKADTWETKIEVYKLRTSAMISGKVREEYKR